jgi:hypothetical protein
VYLVTTCRRGIIQNQNPIQTFSLKNIHILEAGKRHIDGLFDLHLKLDKFMKEETNDPYLQGNLDIQREHRIKSIHETLACHLSKTIVAEYNGDLIAFVSGEIKPCFFATSKVKKVGYISSLFVEEPFRKQRIMTQMVEIISESFVALNAEFIEVCCHESSGQGHHFWHKKGYRPYRSQYRIKVV